MPCVKCYGPVSGLNLNPIEHTFQFPVYSIKVDLTPFYNSIEHTFQFPVYRIKVDLTPFRSEGRADAGANECPKAICEHTR